MQIKETIVVEGKDDESAVKKAVNASIIITHGFGISETTFRDIEWAREKTGVIIFTDPDSAGEQIRRRINNRIKGCKNAYLTKREARKKDNIGIENAGPKEILDALQKARCIKIESKETFTIQDLIDNNLSASPDASYRRQELGRILRIGYANAGQFLKKLNHYGISKEEFIRGISKIN